MESLSQDSNSIEEAVFSQNICISLLKDPFYIVERKKISAVDFGARPLIDAVFSQTVHQKVHKRSPKFGSVLAENFPLVRHLKGKALALIASDTVIVGEQLDTKEMIFFLSSGWFAVSLYRIGSALYTAEFMILFLWKQEDKVKEVVLQSSNL